MNIEDDITSVFTEFDRVLFRKLFLIFGANFCCMSPCLSKFTCEQLWKYAKSHPEELLLHSAHLPIWSEDDFDESNTSSSRRKQPKKQRSLNSYAFYKKRMEVTRETDLPVKYTPCNHDGPCSEATKCSCANNLQFCEKYCACSKSCANRFPGCHCRGCRCRTKACPCFAASRECDPDLCKHCDGHFPPGMEPTDGRACLNVSLQYRQRAALLLSRSKIHGWGAFSKDQIDKNDLVTEYLGEIISQEEADRRGRIYDKFNRSYLFNLDSAEVVDAARKGNKIKFANHSDNPNCFSKIMLGKINTRNNNNNKNKF